MSAARAIGEPLVSEGVWQAWLQARPIPHYMLPPWLPAARRLVVVAPHPDDELLACGGLLALHARRAGECLVVGVTDGEASHAGARGWSAAPLAAQRRAERLAGLRCLGVGLDAAQVHRLGLCDGDVANQADPLTGALQRLLRAGDVVVTAWRMDGHPDHEATGHAAATACAVVGCRLVEAPVWMWHWARPGDARVPWQRLQCLALGPDLWPHKQAAIACHRSQLAPRGPGQGPVLDAALLSRARRAAEHFFV